MVANTRRALMASIKLALVKRGAGRDQDTGAVGVGRAPVGAVVILVGREGHVVARLKRLLAGALVAAAARFRFVVLIEKAEVLSTSHKAIAVSPSAV
jgi:hypothetical protein